MRHPKLALLAAACIVLLGACTASPPGSTASSSSTAGPASATIDRLVDIGGGRELKLDCRGTGSPTVLLLSGTGGAGDEWMSVVDPADTGATPALSADSVFDRLAATTRVCTYDRPGTTLSSGADTTSTPVSQPTTARDGADDLDRLLSASGQRGPYVLVGASWGGMIAQLFARLHPKETKGIVLVDSASAYLKDTLTPTQWTNWMAVIVAAHTTPSADTPDYDASVAELDAADPAPRMPAAVLSSDHPWDLGVTPGMSTWPGWLAAQADLAKALDATHTTKTDSGHGIAVERPALVIAAIRGVIERTR